MTTLDAQAPPDGGAGWSGDFTLYPYLIPGESNFTLVIGEADRGALHLEGRWNYEDIDAGSLFAGWTLAFGDAIDVEVTPMAGLVVGSVLGVAPGLELDVRLGPVEFYAESEYVIDLRSRGGSFFYILSELSVRPVAPLQLGVTGQRRRLRQTPLEIDRGPFAMLTVDRFTAGAYVLNPWSDSAFTILALGVAF